MCLLLHLSLFFSQLVERCISNDSYAPGNNSPFASIDASVPSTPTSSEFVAMQIVDDALKNVSFSSSPAASGIDMARKLSFEHEEEEEAQAEPSSAVAKKTNKKKRKSTSNANTTTKKKKARRNTNTKNSNSDPMSPFKSDTLDTNFIKTLHDPKRDAGKVNSAHILIRKSVLEVRRTRTSGRVFLQCKYCNHLPIAQRTNQSILCPQSIGRLYNANIRFVMNHMPYCEYIPDKIKAEHAMKNRTKLPNGSGGKAYWKRSARCMGLRTDTDKKFIVYVEEKDTSIKKN